ncbi:calpain-B-like [Contarinia nasturtii]|uniref:calpain-B-like n=1 Tax=Contarinia nasturtii TaxID=265458 RepID=UPI0012D3B40A|nr:calpain-B-like [Contarinia nasturtii]
MSFTKYPKNYHQNGLGWQNTSALSYPSQQPDNRAVPPSTTNLYPGFQAFSNPFQMPPLPGSTNHYDSARLSYGFAPNITACHIPNEQKPQAITQPSGPSIGWALQNDLTDGCTHSTPANDSPVEKQVEIPCQAIIVPDEDMPIYSFGYPSLSERGRGPRSEQDYTTLRDYCLENGTLFEDSEFPPIDSSLQFSRRMDRRVEWLRPSEIAHDPQFFVEGFSRFDVQQGELGDCWLLAATANLTQNPKMFFRVVPDDQDFEDNYAGIFHFRFWQYGKWVDVVIDDLLPTYRGELLYMRSTEQNEFWSALLEKAYAKLHGSYEALKGGTTCEAMEDFTGGVTEMYDLSEAPPNLFNILLKGYERNSMMACSIEPDPSVFEAETREGLIKGHAYSITKIELMDISTPNKSGKIPMLRIRNPWGNDAEWNGPWSDSSPEWRYIPDHEKERIGLTFDHDGEFWMSFQDWMKYFDRVEICNLSPDSLTEEQISGGKKRWEMSVFEGAWVQGATAGGCRNYLETFWQNPQYTVALETPDENDDDGLCTLIVALMQKNRRSRRNVGMDCLTIGFAIYRVTERDMMSKPIRMNFFKYNASVARSPAFINLREVSCRFKLPRGNYLIVPSTFEPNEEGEFLIRVFSEQCCNMECSNAY